MHGSARTLVEQRPQRGRSSGRKGRVERPEAARARGRVQRREPSPSPSDENPGTPPVRRCRPPCSATTSGHGPIAAAAGHVQSAEPIGTSARAARMARRVLRAGGGAATRRTRPRAARARRAGPPRQRSLRLNRAALAAKTAAM
jgi:hypothetical protein